LFVVAELLLSYGFDGSSGHSNYKQGFAGPQKCDVDGSIFATTVTPLRMIDYRRNKFWNNRTPQSIRFCRPLKLEFIKETKECIIKEHTNLEKQIKCLQSSKFVFENGKTVYINFRLYLTEIDGKVLNTLTGTRSTQSCPICGATPLDFLNNKNFKCEKFLPNQDNLKYGLSPLHRWILRVYSKGEL